MTCASLKLSQNCSLRVEPPVWVALLHVVDQHLLYSTCTIADPV